MAPDRLFAGLFAHGDAAAQATDRALLEAMVEVEVALLEVLADLGDDLREVIRRRRPEMETAHDRVHFFDAGHFLRLPHRVDDADMAARTDDDEPFVFQIEARRMFVDVFVRIHEWASLVERIHTRLVAPPPLIKNVVMV